MLVPDYALSGRPRIQESGDVRSPGEIDALRGACAQAAGLLRTLLDAVAPGVSTDELDGLAYEECRRRRIYPSPLNYRGYPKSICTSVNEVICHGIPDGRRLRSGDTLNVDVTVFAGGAHGDCSATVGVGEVNPVARRLVDAARECLDAGVEAVGPGRPISAIGRAVEAIAAGAGYSVVRDFVGHGIGPVFHTGLQIFHHHDPGLSRPMEPGMVFTVEPMINAGTHRAHLWPNGWTAVTADLARSVQFEHTVLVTDDGVEVLTA